MNAEINFRVNGEAAKLIMEEQQKLILELGEQIINEQKNRQEILSKIWFHVNAQRAQIGIANRGKDVPGVSFSDIGRLNTHISIRADFVNVLADITAVIEGQNKKG